MNKRLPQGWEVTPLSSVIADLESGVSVNATDGSASAGEPGVLKVSAVFGGRFYPRENKAIVSADRPRATVYPRRGDLVISRANTFDLVGACGYVEHDFPHLFLPDKLWRVVLHDPERDDMRWLMHVLNSPAVREELRARATGTSGSMKNISKDSFLGIPVHRPSAADQKRIAQVLDKWDKTSQLLSDLISLKRHLKTGLARKLLSGGRRFPEFAGRPWSDVLLRDVTAECTERNAGRLGAGCVKGVTKSEGMVPMRERVIGASLERYKVVCKDWFAYNPMRLNIGSIARWAKGEDVLVSPDYVVFRCLEGSTEPGLSPEYLDQYRRSGDWARHVSVAGNGSVRIRIYYSDLARLPLRLPCLTEQRRIASILSVADREVALLSRQLEAVNKQKRGLMSKLLTGLVGLQEDAA